jgi:hypothetical protein
LTILSLIRERPNIGPENLHLQMKEGVINLQLLQVQAGINQVATSAHKRVSRKLTSHSYVDKIFAAIVEANSFQNMATMSNAFRACHMF